MPSGVRSPRDRGCRVSPNPEFTARVAEAPEIDVLILDQLVVRSFVQKTSHRV